MTERHEREREQRARRDPSEPTELEVAWREHISSDTSRLDGLIRRHRERQRRYHNVGHVESVVRLVKELAGIEAVGDLDAVVAAAFYHDAIYEPMHPANERASARLARRNLASLGWEDARVDAVSAMIEGTKTHSDPADIDTAVLFDADLAILGADPDVYGDYATRVRGEYRHLDDREWSAGRTTVLGELLDRAQIYATKSAQTRWETSARSNIATELDTLAR